MCGFAGFLSFASGQLDGEVRRRILSKMGQAMGHRGPDDEQIYDDGTLALVFRRLSIVGGLRGQQPIFNEARDLILACNGEIYNHVDLQRTLSDRHRFSTTSDCEVLLHGYEEWGINALQRTRGMFALALWDSRKRQLLLARDRLGIKPLYICKLPNGLLFGSELKALMAHPQCPRGIDWAAFGSKSLSPSATPTYIRGIEHLPGGSYLVAEYGKEPRRGKYWKLDDHFGSAPFGLEGQRYSDEFRRLIVGATEEHLQGDWSAGIHLSGGIDSSLLAAIVARHMPDTPCFSLVERTTLLAGDVAAAQGVASTLGLPWCPVLFDYRTLLDDVVFSLDWLEASVWMMDSPQFDLEWLLKQELTRAVRTYYPDVKVLLLGQGADEFAGGYSQRLDRPHDSWNAYLADEILPMLSEHGVDRDFAGMSPGSFVGPYHGAMRLMSFQLQYHNLWHEDRTSSWHSLEARVPFLDHRIVELLASVPAPLHRELFWNKRIVRDCLKSLLPSYDVERPKVGFCSTNDTRSIQIIVHNMALRLARDFQEKYVAASDFPFDRDGTNDLIARVVARRPGFYEDSFRLMSRMSATIFARLCHAGAPAGAEVGRRLGSVLEVVEADRWQDIWRDMAAEPAMPFAWRTDDIPQLFPGTRTQCRRHAQGAQCMLLVDRQVIAEIGIASTDAWATTFIERLGGEEPVTRSIGQWIDELSVPREVFLAMLNVLLQCGFVTAPARATEYGAEDQGHGPAPTSVAMGYWPAKSFRKVWQRWKGALVTCLLPLGVPSLEIGGGILCEYASYCGLLPFP